MRHARAYDESILRHAPIVTERPSRPTIWTMQHARVLLAFLVAGITAAGAVWLYTYRVPADFTYVEYLGGHPHRYHSTETVMVQPWWGIYATIAVALAGGAILTLLLPRQRRGLKRFRSHFANLS